MFTDIIIDETTTVAVANVSKLTEKLYVITKHFDISFILCPKFLLDILVIIYTFVLKQR